MTTGHPELRNLTNKQIHEKLFECVRYERRVQNKILILIQEIQIRKIYLQKGYGSMLSYLITEMKYSESTALRRISAASILNLVPEAKEDLLNGNLNMTQLQKTAMAIKQHEMQKELRVESPSPEQSQNQSCVEGIAEITKKALENIKNKNSHTTDVNLAQSFNIDSISPSRAKVTHHRDESVSLNIKLTAQQFEKLNEVKSILSHVNPSGDTAQILEYLCDMLIKKKRGLQKDSGLDSECQIEARNSSNEAHEHAQNSTSGKCVQQNKNQGQKQIKIYRRKTISQKIRRNVFEKNRMSLRGKDSVQLAERVGCQYKDSITGKVCGSHHQLEVDHIQPAWAGGSDEADNLQILCRAHNQFRYQQQAGFYL